MRNRLFILIICLLFYSSVNAETGKMPEVKNILAGKSLYEKYCLQCHNENGIGESMIPQYIRKPGYVTAMPLNETSHAWHHSDEQLADNILNGLKRTKRMPAFKNILSLKDAYDLVAYIKSLWSPRIIACQGPKHMSCMRH